MAPHDTDPKKEARRHVGPLVGLAAVVAAVAIGFFLFVGQSTKEAETDDSAVEGTAVDPDGMSTTAPAN